MGYQKLPVEPPVYPTLASFPATNSPGAAVIALNTASLYIYNGSAYILIGGGAEGDIDSLAGDVITTAPVAGVAQATVRGINSTLLSGLATGILKNTTLTGVPSIAVAADFPTLNQNTTGSAASFTGNLAGDVTGTQGNTVVALVATSTASDVHNATLLANAATDAATASTIVRRDSGGGFAAGLVTVDGLIVNGLTENGILFATASSAIAQDTTNFKWNFSTKVLTVLGKAAFGVAAVTSGAFIDIQSVGVTDQNIYFTNFSGTPGTGTSPNFIVRGARNTQASPSALLTNDPLMTVNARGYGATGFSAAGRGVLQFLAAENWTDSAQGVYALIGTTPVGTATRVEHVRIGSAGGLILSSGNNPTNLFDAPSGGTLTGAQIGFAAGTSAPTNGFVVAEDVAFGTSSTSGRLYLYKAVSGQECLLNVESGSNTSGANAKIALSAAGTNADALLAMTNNSVAFAQGVDSSAAAYKLSASSSLGSSDTMVVTAAGEVTFPLTPAFMAYQASSQLNCTGDGTTYVLGTTTDLTEVFDQGGDFNPATGVYTSPITAKHDFGGHVLCLEVGAGHTAGEITISTSNRNFIQNIKSFANCRASSNTVGTDVLAFTDMDEGDTASCSITVYNSTLTVDVYGASNDPRTFFSGKLAC